MPWVMDRLNVCSAGTSLDCWAHKGHAVSTVTNLFASDVPSTATQLSTGGKLNVNCYSSLKINLILSPGTSLLASVHLGSNVLRHNLQLRTRNLRNQECSILSMMNKFTEEEFSSGKSAIALNKASLIQCQVNKLKTVLGIRNFF